MDFSQIPMNPYGAQDMMSVEAAHAQGMLDPNMMPHNPYVPPPMFPGSGASQLGGSREYKQLHSIMADGGNTFGVSCLCFDTQELLWMGNQGGHVTSYYGPSMQKYTSFQVHRNEDVRQMTPLKDRGILSLTQSSLRLSNRRGLAQFTFTNQDMHDMQCMLVTSPSSLLIAGHQTKVIELDVNTVKEKQKYEVKEPGCAILRQTPKYICAGDTSGNVTLYDPATLKPEHVLEAHSGTLSDFDIHSNFLVTCGYSNRMVLSPDRYLKMYDLRMLRPMSPMQLVIDPTFLRFVPTYTSRIAVVSQVGQFQVIETLGTASLDMYQVQCHNSLIMSFDVSTTCQAMAFGDSGGYLHLFATDENVTFNSYPEETSLADPVDPSQNIHIHDLSTPYAMVPMSYPGAGKLLSDWPAYLTEKTYRKPKPVDAEILRSMKVYHNVGYAPNPGKEKRNQMPYMKENEGSVKGKAVPESPIGRGDDPFMAIPKRFRKVDLKYSKLGLEDFDFRHYNKTHFAGLEIHIPNVYCNSMLQIFYFIEPLRVKLLNHLCEREFCLSCELGFLFHMLDKQKGQTCQASNFLRAFRTLPEAAALGLVLAENEENLGRVNLCRLIQSWQRFMHQQVHSETSPPKPVVEDKPEEGVTEVEKDEQGSEASGETPAQTNEETDKLSEEKTKDEKAEKEQEAKKEEPKSKSKKKKKKGKKDKKEEKKPTTQTETASSTSGTQQEADKPEGEATTEANQEGKSQDDKDKKDGSVVTDIFGLNSVTTLRCRCGQDNKKQVTTTLVNLNYPDCSGQGLNKGPVAISFVQVLEHSLTLEQNTQAWCSNCAKYQQHQQSKEVLTLPDVLALNCQLENPRDLEFWKIQIMLLKQKDEGDSVSSTSSSPLPITTTTVMCRYGRKCNKKGCRFRHEQDSKDWLQDDLMKIHTDDENEPIWVPFGFKVQLLENGSLKIEEYSDEETLPEEIDPNVRYYELHSTVSHIRDSKGGGGHLISHIKVGETYHQRKEGVTTTQWYLFNDFSISDVEKEEAVRFNLDWRVPCTIHYIRRDIINHYDLKICNPITSSVLYDESSLINPKKRKLTFAPLATEEDPKEGDIIGLDAEFVSLNQEESELRSDGTRSTLRPSHMSVARITCIRGQGEKLGEPFLDDYICTHEQVVDYLTQYSGIKPGDLDPAQSNRHLTTLKATYQKIRYLVDLGVTFIGHGLKKDFRVINIHVPKNQIIDTVELFHLPRQRMISLKFLAWYFLKINIQSVTHDSVEDARTALQLYLRYQELSNEGMDKVRKVIREMYDFGRKNQWKISDTEGETAEDSAVAFL